MGGIGRCCCAECECLPVEDLPTVTITNHTGGGWTGTCCYQQIFTPNTTPSWSKSCSGLLYEGSVSEQCVTDHFIQYGSDYRGYEFFPSSCEELPQDFCCLGDTEKIATTTTNWAFTDNAFMAVWRRPKHILVRVSREDVNCDGVEGQTGGCKIVIRSRYVYEYRSKIYKNQLTSIDQTVNLINETCFEVDDRYEIDINAPSAITCSDVPADPPSISLGGCVYEGEFYFDRVQYFATMPDGAIEFTNADVPGCAASTCNYDPYNYTAQVCIYGPSGNIDDSNCSFAVPCYCSRDVQVNDQQKTSNDTICLGEIITEVGPCQPPGLCLTYTTICNNPGDPPLFTYDCNDGVTVDELGYLIDCVGSINGSDGVGSDGTGASGPIIDDNSVLKYLGCGGCAPKSGCYPRNQQDTANIYPYAKTYNCGEDPCNEDCCFFYDDCPNCFPNGTCIEKYAEPYSTTVTHTRTQSCTGLTSQSVCTNAPQWTINLA